ncbi:MAG: hypothetical protein ACLQU4_11985 [Limisphaerales bacterium]
MTYTTLTYGGVEKSLADWGVSSWSRTAQNQANDEFTCAIPTPMDGNDIFSYGAQVIIKINRICSQTNPTNPTLPTSLTMSPGLSYSGGTQWFWGYCIDNDRVGEPGAESFNYKFAGPYQFFFDRLIFQKLMATWNGTEQIADWQSDIILGLSLTVLTGSGDTVSGTTSTNLMSIAQQVKEICLYAQADSAWQQANNGLGWPGTVQFQCDQLTAEIDGVNWDLLQTASANVLISDYFGAPLSGKTSASTLPAGSFMLRCPLDAVNAITCADAMRRQLQWLGGIGSPVVWTDHSQTPPQLHIATRDQLTAKNLALTGITVKNKIKRRTDLIPAAVHFKYKVAGVYLNAPYDVIINDVAAYIGGTLVEGIGQFGALVNPLTAAALSSGNQTALMAAAKTATAVVQTLDFQGPNVSAQSATITTSAVNFGDPAGGGTAPAFWQSVFPHLVGVSNLRFFDATHCPVTFTDPMTGAAVNVTDLGYRLPDGQLASWMTNSGTITAKKVRVTAYFAYTENLPGANTVAGSTVGFKEEHCDITLTNAVSGNYSTTPTEIAGEPVPYGLAGYILALESIPQYEGSILVQEQEITDVCPIGNVLNITGGLTAWTTMDACVQSVRYADNGQTEITFGAAKHLGPSQFIARFRNNIGPRWYLLINPNPMNTGASGALAVPPNVAQQAASPGAKNFTFQSLFTSLTSDRSGTPATLPAGVHVDSGAAANPFTGSLGSAPVSRAFGQAQGVTLAAGPNAVVSGPGEQNPWIRVHIHDLTNGSGALQNLQVYLREIATCEEINGVATPMYRVFLCSNPYSTSLGI